MNNYKFIQDSIQDTGQSKTFGFSPAMTGSFAAGNVIGGANPILISTPDKSMQEQLLGMQSAIGNKIDPATGRPASPSSRAYGKITHDSFYNDGKITHDSFYNDRKITHDSFYNGFGGFRAEGGPVEGGKSYIVGEDGVEYYVDEKGNMVPVGLLGAELIEAPKDGFIIPNQDSQGFSNALLGQVTPTITAQIPGIQNITLGQAPIVSQEGIQYQTPEVQEQSENGFFEQNPNALVRFVQNVVNTPKEMSRRFDEFFGTSMRALTPEEELGYTPPSFGDVLATAGIRDAEGNIFGSGGRREPITGPTRRPPAPITATPETTDQLLGQLTPTTQSIAGVEQALQPEATFTLPSGEVRSIMPGQDVASAFGRENNGLMTFQVDGGEVTVPSAQAIQTMNLGEQAAARQAQQEFLASPAAREMSNRMLQSVMNDPYAQASREREARLAAKPDFMRAVSDRERRGTGEMSMASATKLTGGDRDKARAMIELQRQGRDPMTGKEVKAPFEPKEIEIGGKKYIQLTPDYIQPVEEPRAPKKSEIESIREEGVKAGLPENLIRQSIASKLGLDIYDEGVANWMAGNTDTVPSVEGASESSTFDPTSLTGQDKEAYDWAMANPNSPQSAQILARLSK